MTVLILAREFDPTADAVVGALAERQVPVFRTDFRDFPRWLGLNAELRDGRWSGRLWTLHREVELGEVRSIWNRNPSSYVFLSSMTVAEQDFAYREAKLGLGGVLASLDVLWANHPNRCADAIFKPYQWKVAAECGLLVADTIITNDPASALRFVDRHEGTITKALGTSGITEDGQQKVAYTRLLNSDDLAEIGCVSLTATTLQKFVPKAFEVRLTIIGDQWFPIAIHAATDGAYTDWRSDPSALTYEFVPIPDTVADGVLRYLKRTNLTYAGLDFVVTPDERWVATWYCCAGRLTGCRAGSTPGTPRSCTCAPRPSTSSPRPDRHATAPMRSRPRPR
ncbi:MAG: MvdC/MvdD family ATP grasp protein [Pseudonocardiaceae bacterium]